MIDFSWRDDQFCGIVVCSGGAENNFRRLASFPDDLPWPVRTLYRTCFLRGKNNGLDRAYAIDTMDILLGHVVGFNTSFIGDDNMDIFVTPCLETPSMTIKFPFKYQPVGSTVGKINPILTLHRNEIFNIT